MAGKNYRDAHVLKGAFLSNGLLRLVDLIALQGDDLLGDADIIIPSRAVACTLFIGDTDRVSVADIAKALDEPHQLTTQRTDVLSELGLLKRIDDPDDSRRKLLMLTRKGKDQYRRLIIRLAEIEQAFLGLYAEIECDLPIVLARAIEALDRTPMLKRIQMNDKKVDSSTPRRKGGHDGQR